MRLPELPPELVEMIRSEEYMRAESLMWLGSCVKSNDPWPVIEAAHKVNPMLDKYAMFKALAGTEAPPIAEDATHYDLASHYINSLGKPKPVADENHIWLPDTSTGLWKCRTLASLQAEIGSNYTVKYCKRLSDYRAVAQLTYDLCYDPHFFIAAPIGLAVDGEFYQVKDQQIDCVPLTPELRQRFAVNVRPEEDNPTLFLAFLESTFAHVNRDVQDQQIKLLQEVVGAVLCGIAYKFEVVVLLIGPGGAGKSTLLRIIEALIPREYVCAISPFAWGNEYYRASLAGKRMNLVGELPGDKQIPADQFKQVTGRDRVTGRYPHGRPFDFQPTAAHLFNSNHFPNTRDQSSGFWRRWLCLGFDNPVKEDQREKDLDRSIIQHELPVIVHWALEGAARVVAQDGFSKSQRSDQLIDEWRQKSDAVAEFIHDTEAVTIDLTHDTPRTEVYESFKQWCRDVQRRPMSKAVFYARLEGLGFRLKRKHGYDYVEGLRLLMRS
ncbi:MAG: phage/plasmid primase, P4 family [Candidatus Thiodiazotropha endolucinida]